MSGGDFDRYTIRQKEDLVCCPYDSSHIIREKIVVSHLKKCRKNHPDVILLPCPFNAKHLINEMEYRYHVSNCEDIARIEPDLIYRQQLSTKNKGYTDVPAYNEVCIVPSEEDWDTELEQLKDEIVAKKNAELRAQLLPKYTIADRLQQSRTSSSSLPTLPQDHGFVSRVKGSTSQDDISDSCSTNSDESSDVTSQSAMCFYPKISLQSLPLAGIGRGRPINAEDRSKSYSPIPREVGIKTIGRGRAYSAKRYSNAHVGHPSDLSDQEVFHSV